jgi:Protein of unknown function (DUF2961)
MSGPLAELPILSDSRSARASSWDRTGGNDDRIHVPPGQTATLARIGDPGVIRHIWMTLACAEKHFLRKLVLRAWWDGETRPSIEAPVGDFFGMGHARTHNFASLPLQMSPEDGKAFNCFFPMPFSTARFELSSECNRENVIAYFYIDYELTGADNPRLGRLHAQWRRTNPTKGISEEGLSNEEYLFGGTNLDGRENYTILEAEGKGHYVGCNVNIDNLRHAGLATFNWYGEGDDMIFVDGEPFPPSLHGTGTEDYFNTAWCPTQEYSAPYHGIVMPGERNWAGKVSLYRFHIEDPIRFQKSIRVTIEHGHANRRSDDWSSTAYWYQSEPHAEFPALLPVAQRLPREEPPLEDE